MLGMLPRVLNDDLPGPEASIDRGARCCLGEGWAAKPQNFSAAVTLIEKQAAYKSDCLTVFGPGILRLLVLVLPVALL